MTENQNQEQTVTALSLLKNKNTLTKLEEIFLDKQKSTSFLTTVMSVISNNKSLKAADPTSVFNACMTAASLNLPVNPNLGFAYIVPYRNKHSGKQEAQFQVGYKGFIQLAIRSGQFENIEVKEVYEGQIIDDNSFLGYTFSWKNKTSDKIIGYAAYFKLLSGFNKILYMTTDEVTKHANKYSQSYKSGYGLWKDDFDSMARKTVLKLLLQKYGALSTDMQKAEIADQGVIGDDNLDNVKYPDNNSGVNSASDMDPELVEYWKKKIEACKTLEELKALRDENKPTHPTILSLFNDHEQSITKTSVQS